MNVSPRQNPAYRLSRCAFRRLWRARWVLLLCIYAALVSGLSHMRFGGYGAPLFPGADKLFHVAEFALFTVLAWRAFERRMLPALLTALAFAAVDELHQSFVPTRVASPFDGAADALGAMLALAVLRWGPRLWALLRRRILEETHSDRRI